MGLYKVKPGKTISHEGKVYTSGKVIDMKEKYAKPLLAAGDVTEIRPKKIEVHKPTPQKDEGGK